MTNELGKKIKEYRQAHGMSQKDFGRLVGTSIASVSQWEAGRSTPQKRYSEKLKEILDGESPETREKPEEAPPKGSRQEAVFIDSSNEAEEKAEISLEEASAAKRNENAPENWFPEQKKPCGKRSAGEVLEGQVASATALAQEASLTRDDEAELKAIMDRSKQLALIADSIRIITELDMDSLRYANRMLAGLSEGVEKQ